MTTQSNSELQRQAQLNQADNSVEVITRWSFGQTKYSFDSGETWLTIQQLNEKQYAQRLNGIDLVDERHEQPQDPSNPQTKAILKEMI